MKTPDRVRLLEALSREDSNLPPGWRATETHARAPRGVVLIPPTGASSFGRPLPWAGPGAKPRGLSLCRILATCDQARHFSPPGERSVLMTGLPGDRRMRCLGHGYTGKGWVQQVVKQMTSAAWDLHLGTVKG
jgi:hypothetical protein